MLKLFVLYFLGTTCVKKNSCEPVLWGGGSRPAAPGWQRVGLAEPGAGRRPTHHEPGLRGRTGELVGLGPPLRGRRLPRRVEPLGCGCLRRPGGPARHGVARSQGLGPFLGLSLVLGLPLLRPPGVGLPLHLVRRVRGGFGFWL